MEKFGLFNLLAALSDLAAGTDETRPQAPPQTGQHDARPAPSADADAARRAANAGALLERHAAISRRIDRRNGK